MLQHKITWHTFNRVASDDQKENYIKPTVVVATSSTKKPKPKPKKSHAK